MTLPSHTAQLYNGHTNAEHYF